MPTPTPDPSPSAQLQQQWWGQWKSRIGTYVQHQVAQFQPDRIDVVAHAAEAVPIDLLKLDLGQMTLAEWSRVLISALAAPEAEPPQRVPLWMAVPALDHLGFGSTIGSLERLIGGKDLEQKVSSHSGLQEEAQQVREWASHYGPRSSSWAARPSAFIVSTDGGSVSTRWMPSKRYAGFVLHAAIMGVPWGSGIMRLTQFFAGQKSPIFDALLVEADPAQPEAYEQWLAWVEPQRQQASGPSAVFKSSLSGEALDAWNAAYGTGGGIAARVYLITARDSATPESSVPVIRGATDFDDAMNRALRET